MNTPALDERKIFLVPGLSAQDLPVPVPEDVAALVALYRRKWAADLPPAQAHRALTALMQLAYLAGQDGRKGTLTCSEPIAVSIAV